MVKEDSAKYDINGYAWWPSIRGINLMNFKSVGYNDAAYNLFQTHEDTGLVKVKAGDNQS